MNSLFGLAAAPTALHAGLHGVDKTVGALAKPFAAFFQTAGSQSESVAVDAAAEATALESQLAHRLQGLFASLGVGPGEEATLRLDGAAGEVLVDGHREAAAIEQAIQSDPQLLVDLQRLADLHGQFDPLVSPDRWELQVETAADGKAVLLRWR